MTDERMLNGLTKAETSASESVAGLSQGPEPQTLDEFDPVIGWLRVTGQHPYAEMVRELVIANDQLHALGQSSHRMFTAAVESLASISDALGIAKDDQECANGAFEIIQAISDLKRPVDSSPAAFQYWTVGGFWNETSRLGYEARLAAGDRVRLLYEHPPSNLEEAAIDLLSEWCVDIEMNGTAWDDWDENWKACYRDGPLKEKLAASMEAYRNTFR